MLGVLALAWFGGFAALGAYVAAQKRRPGGEGFFLGLLFGPLGALIEALLPNGADGSNAAQTPKPDAPWHGFVPQPAPDPEPARPSRVGKPLRPLE